MQNFLFLVDKELEEQVALRTREQKVLSRIPEGFLKLRRRDNKNSFYWNHKVDGKRREVNITDNDDMTHRLLQKRIYTEAGRRAETNIQALRELKKVYTADSIKDIIKELPDSYKTVYDAHMENQLWSWKDETYERCPFDPERHIHETVCGIMVRSKSEVIIANALTSYGIPFHYEERLYLKDGSQRYWYPDFTFQVPLIGKKYWEHLGMLDKKSYCEHNAEKLYNYQKSGLMIGQNLIITQDNYLGSCNSSFIDEVIRTELLPYFL